MKKLNNERPTWASFRHIPNDKEGQKFLTMFKKYRNLDVLRYHIRYRKPIPGKQYAHGGFLPCSEAKEFSIYINGNPNTRSELQYHKDEETYWKAQSKENYNNRCDWRNSYYEVIQSSFWFWFKLRYAPFGRYLFRKLTFWRNHYA